MHKKTIEYVDFDGNTRTEVCYFNLRQTDLIDIQNSVEGGMAAHLQRITDNVDVPAAIEFFKLMIEKSYGEKSADGRSHMKTKAIVDAFTYTEAYNVLLMELIENPEKATEFLQAIMPANLREQMKVVPMPSVTSQE